MYEEFKVILLEDYKVFSNSRLYSKDEIVEVIELKSFKDVYAVYTPETLDFIPKKLVKKC